MSTEKMWDEYHVKLTLTRPMLGTNPSDPAILDTHILEKQRKLISEKGGVNSVLNKYFSQIQISPERGKEDGAKLVDKLEEIIGTPLTPDQREMALLGKLDELRETFAELDTKGTTVFFWDKKSKLPCIGDHMIPGFLKAAADAICKAVPKANKKNGTILQSATYTFGVINQHVSVKERFIISSQDLMRHSDGVPIYNQRSLRVITAQGPRVTLAKSEMIDAGAEFEFHVRVMKESPMTEEILRKLFSYGAMKGLGQWRNANWGQFDFELEPLHADVHVPVSKSKSLPQQATMQ